MNPSPDEKRYEVVKLDQLIIVVDPSCRGGSTNTQGGMHFTVGFTTPQIPGSTVMTVPESLEPSPGFES